MSPTVQGVLGVLKNMVVRRCCFNFSGLSFHVIAMMYQGLGCHIDSPGSQNRCSNLLALVSDIGDNIENASA